jgi:hypothetical protein
MDGLTDGENSGSTQQAQFGLELCAAAPHRRKLNLWKTSIRRQSVPGYHPGLCEHCFRPPSSTRTLQGEQAPIPQSFGPNDNGEHDYDYAHGATGQGRVVWRV